jgi:hypothetical protein
MTKALDGCVTAAVMCLCLATSAAAQTERRWSVAATLGVPGPGPAADLEAAMRASGFDERGGGCVFGLCFPPMEYPRSSTGLNRSLGYPFALQIDRRLSDRGLGLSLLIGRTALGQTWGLHAPLTHLYVEYAVDSLGVMATLERAGFAVGAGPAVHVARLKDADPQFGDGPWERHARVGVLVQGRVMLPARSRLFVDANGQYRYVGNAEVGPIAPHPILEPGATFPRSAVSFSHWLLSVGAGVRF